MKAILVISFGTTHLDTLERSITALERTISDRFPSLPLFRAFTSPRVRSRLSQKYSITVPSPEEAMEQIIAAGYDSVTVQPTLLIPGEEYDLVRETLEKFKDRIAISAGLPLLWEEGDLDRVIDILAQFYHPGEGEILLLMGHGTGHAANQFYPELDRRMKMKKDSRMRLCTVEGTPTFADAVEELQAQPVRQIIAAPMMLVAGDHAKNDMAGEDAVSLRSMLEQAGFTVDCRLVGMGEMEEIRSLYCERALQAKPL